MLAQSTVSLPTGFVPEGMSGGDAAAYASLPRELLKFGLIFGSSSPLLATPHRESSRMSDSPPSSRMEFHVPDTIADTR